MIFSGERDEAERGFGDLFGALIRRKVHIESAVYQDSDLFDLKLPLLQDHDAPDIFVPRSNERSSIALVHNMGFSEEKTQQEPIQPSHTAGDDGYVRPSLRGDAETARYFSLAPKSTFSEAVQRSIGIRISSSSIAELTLLALKGISSQLYDAARLPPAVSVQGYTLTAMRGFVTEMRVYFLLRRMLNAAAEGLTQSADTAAQALGTQLAVLLHLFDISVTELLTTGTGSDTCGGTDAQCGLVNLWQRTELHRTFLLHIVSIVRLENSAFSLSSLKSFVGSAAVGGSQERNSVAELLQPVTWTSLGGWAVLHKLVQSYNNIRHGTGSPTLPAVFQHCLFRNHDAMRLPSASGDRLASDFARKVLTASLVKHVSVPLLAQLTDKLYALDADFDSADSVTDSELASSLEISIEAVWEIFEQHIAKEGDGNTEMGAECCVEFLLAALAWSRGRVALMLLESLGTAHQIGTRALFHDTAAFGAGVGFGPSNKLLPVPVREDAPLRVSKAAHDMTSGAARYTVGTGFDRAALIASFRGHKPILILPMNVAQEVQLQEVRQRSDQLCGELRSSARASVGVWYAHYATMSDYYSEHAVQAKSMFADVDYHIRPPLPGANTAVLAPGLRTGVEPSGRRGRTVQPTTAPHSRAAKRSTKQTAEVATTEPNTVGAQQPSADTVVLTTTVGTERTVPKALIAQAEQKIRAKYDSLMQGVSARSFATAWRKRHLQTLPEARRQLVELFEEDMHELLRLQQAKATSPDKYRQFVAEHQAVQGEADSAAAEGPHSPAGALGVTWGGSARLDLLVAQRAAGKVTEPSPPLFPTSPAAFAASSAGGFTVASGFSDNGSFGSTADLAATSEGTPAAAESDTVSVVPDTPSATEDVAPSDDAVDATGPAVLSSPPDEAPQATQAADRPAPVSTPVPDAELTSGSDPAQSSNAVSNAGETDAAPSLADLPGPLLHPDETYLQEEDKVFAAAKSLAHTIARLARSTQLLDLTDGELQALVIRLLRDDPKLGGDEGALWMALLVEANKHRAGGAAGSDASLHSLRAIFMRSVGRAVLAQCRAINVAAMHCLVSGAVNLLGHISAVDHHFLVSPNSDFLMSLCSCVVDQHLQQMRLLQRQRASLASAALTEGEGMHVSLTHQFANSGNAELWNAEALQVAYAATMSAARNSSSGGTNTHDIWKQYGTQYAALQLSAREDSAPAAEQVNTTERDALASLWSRGLFSSQGLTNLTLLYQAPWPVPAIITPQVLGKIGLITRRFLQLGQVVALFRVVWGEMRLFRVQHSRPTARTMKRGARRVPSAASMTTVVRGAVRGPDGVESKTAQDAAAAGTVRLNRQRADEIERALSDALRLVQLAVQTLFDYLSERVYVHQARFKERVLLASEQGLDGVVEALRSYSDALAQSALQLTPSEQDVVLRECSGSDLAGEESGGRMRIPERMVVEDSSVALKWAVNNLVYSCLQVLLHAKGVNDLRGALSAVPVSGTVVGDSQHNVGIEAGLHRMAQECQNVHVHRATLVSAAERLEAYDMSQGDLQSLIMRFKL
jgi:hypothetical protein